MSRVLLNWSNARFLRADKVEQKTYQRILHSFQKVSLSEVEHMVRGAEREMKNTAARGSGAVPDTPSPCPGRVGVAGAGMGKGGDPGGDRRDGTGVWCDYHHLDTHSNEECSYQRQRSRYGSGGRFGKFPHPGRHWLPTGRGRGGWEETQGQQHHTG
ncbi:unnamed protein product, partial [Pylaiella littoralis]